MYWYFVCIYLVPYTGKHSCLVYERRYSYAAPRLAYFCQGGAATLPPPPPLLLPLLHRIV